jgi:pyruvate/2-oxoglutarate dehydrogenase complex dihydrolipoamide acyltransferase (E2) component
VKTELKMPPAGMGITEGTVIRWLKSKGDVVNEGEVLAEIETAKAITEVSSPITGSLQEILLQEGETAEINTTIALLESVSR